MARTPDDEEKDFQARLGGAIIELRSYRGISQAVLAEKIHRSEPTVSRWETGKSQPSAYDLSKIAELLNAPPEILLNPPERPVSPIALQLAAIRADAVVEDDVGAPTGASGGAVVGRAPRAKAQKPTRKPPTGQ